MHIFRAMVPTLSSALSSHANQETSVLERSLDLLIVLVKPKHVEITQNVYLSIAPALFNMLNTSDDSGILQSGTQLLQALVRHSFTVFSLCLPFLTEWKKFPEKLSLWFWKYFKVHTTLCIKHMDSVVVRRIVAVHPYNPYGVSRYE